MRGSTKGFDGNDEAITVLGSDKDRGPTRGLCFLCGTEQTLRLSHTFPKLAFRQFGRTRGITSVRFDDGVVSTVSAQDGLKHYLLCNDCEQHIGKAEDLLARLCDMQPAELHQHGMELDNASGVWRMAGPKRVLLQRALLMTVVRHHDAPSSGVELAVSGAHRLRGMLRSGLENPGDEKYTTAGLTAIKLFSLDPMRENPRARSMISVDSKQMLAMVVLRGFVFFVPLSDRASADLDEWIVVRGVRDPDHLDFALGDISGLKDYALSAQCPCGLDRVFGDCCALGWLLESR